MEKALTRAGMDCRAFESGLNDALEYEERSSSDIRMPGMDGAVLLSVFGLLNCRHHHDDPLDLDSAVCSAGRRVRIPQTFDIDEMVTSSASSQRIQIAASAEATH